MINIRSETSIQVMILLSKFIKAQFYNNCFDVLDAVIIFDKLIKVF